MFTLLEGLDNSGSNSPPDREEVLIPFPQAQMTNMD